MTQSHSYNIFEDDSKWKTIVDKKEYSKESIKRQKDEKNQDPILPCPWNPI